MKPHISHARSITSGIGVNSGTRPNGALHIYDEQIARHYAAYRPPLHRSIVNEFLEGQQFEVGLDIGCGTGCSAISLVGKCCQIFGVDYSQRMLDMASKTPKVTYLRGSGDDLPIVMRQLIWLHLPSLLSTAYLTRGEYGQGQ